MTAEVRKSVTYSTVLSDRHLKSSVRKSVAYAVALPDINGDAGLSKSVGYVAVLQEDFDRNRLRKSVGYAVTFPYKNVDAVQPDPNLRPIYQSGSVPYIDFAGDKSLVVYIPETSVYTLLVLRTNLTFDPVCRVLFTEGVNNIVLTGQVAQFRYLKGDPTPQQIEDLKEEMLSFYANLLPPSVIDPVD